MQELVSMFFYDTFYYFQIAEDKSTCSKFLLPDEQIINEIFSTEEMSNFLKLNLIRIKIPSILNRYCIQNMGKDENQLFNEIIKFEIPMIIFNGEVVYPIEYNDKFVQMLLSLPI